jgi:hypothetical protein
MRDILLRILGNLQRAYSEQSNLADANLIGELVLSLEPAS